MEKRKKGKVVRAQPSAKPGMVDLLVEDESGRQWWFYGCYPVSASLELEDPNEAVLVEDVQIVIDPGGRK